MSPRRLLRRHDWGLDVELGETEVEHEEREREAELRPEPEAERSHHAARIAVRERGRELGDTFEPRSPGEIGYGAGP
jgi:hypothetical protein